jgi:uncharacterized membrane protein
VVLPSEPGFRRLARELRGGFFLRPGLITTGAVLMALLLSAWEERLTARGSWNPFLDRLFPPEPQAAYVVLGTIAGSMITVVSVVYSILLVVLTFTSAQFSPRALVGFVEDKVSQTTLGVFIGTFAYCLLILPAIRSKPEPFVPSIAVLGAMVLAVVCLVCLLFFIHHIGLSIQASHIVDRIARETEVVLDQVFERAPGTGITGERAEAVFPGLHSVPAPASGYIRAIDESGLLAAARRYDACVQVDRYIGQFVAAGMPLFAVSAAPRETGALEAACLDAFDIGPARTMEQDVEFGVLQIVDIALKAISPAVNDPTTAITCIDQLSRILARAARHEPPSPQLRDEEGRTRVLLRRTSFPRMLEVAFSQIRHYGRADVAVPLRMMRVLGELAAVTPNPAYREAIHEQARTLASACAQGFPEADRALLRERLSAVERAVGSSTAVPV